MCAWWVNPGDTIPGVESHSNYESEDEEVYNGSMLNTNANANHQRNAKKDSDGGDVKSGLAALNFLLTQYKFTPESNQNVDEFTMHAYIAEFLKNDEFVTQDENRVLRRVNNTNLLTEEFQNDVSVHIEQTRQQLLHKINSLAVTLENSVKQNAENFQLLHENGNFGNAMFATVGNLSNFSGYVEQIPLKISNANIYLHLRASQAIFFQEDNEALPEDVFGQKTHSFLRDVCGAIGQNASWAYNVPHEKTNQNFKLTNRWEIKIEEPFRKAKIFLHRGRIMERLIAQKKEIDSNNTWLRKVSLGTEVWRYKELLVMDVSVDEALARRAKNVYRGFCDRYMLDMYASGNMLSLLKTTEDEIRMFVDNHKNFQDEWIMEGFSSTQQLNESKNEIEKIATVINLNNDGDAREMTNINRSKHLAFLLLLTWAQLGRFDNMSSEIGTATFLIFDERVPKNQKDTEQIFHWFYKENVSLSESFATIASTNNATHASSILQPNVNLIEEQNHIEEPNDWLNLYVEAINAFKEGKKKFFVQLIEGQENVKSLSSSKFLSEFSWRINFLKLARTLHAENTIINERVVSGREQRRRATQLQKSEAKYFFQGLINKRQRISPDFLLY